MAGQLPLILRFTNNKALRPLSRSVNADESLLLVLSILLMDADHLHVSPKTACESEQYEVTQP